MKRHHRYFLFLLIISLTDVCPALSQRVTFKYIEKPEVDPWSIVVSITQDSQGYMWFAGNGIHRYDGKNVITYRNDPVNPNSLIDNAVETLFADDNNLIWIGTQGAGMDCFNIVTKTFTHYRQQDGLSKGTISAITKDREGNIWIGTSEGLDRLDPKTAKFSHYRHDADDSGSLSNNTVRAIYVDRQDVVWVGTGSPFHSDAGKNNKEGGLNRLDRKTNRFTRYLHNDNDPSSLVDNRVRSIYEDSHGIFWVGTAGDGLHSLDRATGKFKRFPYDPMKLSRSPVLSTLSYVDDHITFIREDATGSLWIGTMMSGITQYDPKSGSIIRYGSGKDSTGDFPDKSGWAAYSSRDGIFWVSTWETGLYRINPFEQNFPYYKTGEHVHGIYEEANGDTWICTHTGLLKMDSSKRIIKRYFFDITQGSSRYDINGLLRDRAGNFWITTGEGLISFNPLTEKIEKYTHDDADKNSLSGSVVLSVFEDHNLDLWVGTFMKGLNKMERKTGKFINYMNKSQNAAEDANKNTSLVIQEDRNKHLWVGTFDGVNQVNPNTGTAKNYLKGTTIYTIFEGGDSTLWLGGSDGLFRYRPATDSFTAFLNPGSGIGYKNVRNIFEDRQKNLWISSSTGLFRFNPNRDSSNAFEDVFGLRNIVDAGYILNSVNKEVFLGDQTGYYRVLLDHVSGNFLPPGVAFIDFRLGEQSMLTKTNSILPDGLSQAKKIHLSYKQNVFSFDFDVLHFANAQSNQCIYKLENYDNKWRQTGVERTASYFNVPPGHYTFRVKGSSSNGIWFEKSIEVIISPPWWQTWWAYTIFAILLGTTIWAFVAYRSRALRLENRILEEKVSQRTIELKQSLDNLKLTQAQLVQSEKMASLGELTAGIAHEIQNPLNFVNNFSEVSNEMLDEMKEQLAAIATASEAGSRKQGNVQLAMGLADNVKQNLEKINHHGKRADAIVKGMLQHARTTGGQKEPTDINALADEYIRLAYHGMRTKDNSFNAIPIAIGIETDFDNTIGKINIVPQEIGRVILNLVNNAFYAINEKRQKNVAGYEPKLTVTTKKLDGKVEINVKDNGNGISPAIIDKIFQPFFTTKPTGQGTGLGLSLAYDIVKAHGGNLRVETNEGQGSAFIMILPI